MHGVQRVFVIVEAVPLALDAEFFRAGVQHGGNAMHDVQ